MISGPSGELQAAEAAGAAAAQAVAVTANAAAERANPETRALLERTGLRRGICVVAGTAAGELAIELARGSELVVYVQPAAEAGVAAARQAAADAGLLGRRLFIGEGPPRRLRLADNLAAVVIALPGRCGVRPAGRRWARSATRRSNHSTRPASSSPPIRCAATRLSTLPAPRARRWPPWQPPTAACSGSARSANYDLLLRDEGLYAFGTQPLDPSLAPYGAPSQRLEALTGKVLAQNLPFRRNCMRVTG